MRRRSSLKPQFVIGRSQVSAITSSRKLPSPLTADTVTATHRHMRSSENFATQGAGQGHALPPCLGSYCLQGTYLFIAMISTFLGFSWVMSVPRQCLALQVQDSQAVPCRGNTGFLQTRVAVRWQRVALVRQRHAGATCTVVSPSG